MVCMDERGTVEGVTVSLGSACWLEAKGWGRVRILWSVGCPSAETTAWGVDGSEHGLAGAKDSIAVLYL